jgi:protein tyrosine phosphatase (PTP) superfamily phosphohydrolase (DUF442 family)
MFTYIVVSARRLGTAFLIQLCLLSALMFAPAASTHAQEGAATNFRRAFKYATPMIAHCRRQP